MTVEFIALVGYLCLLIEAISLVAMMIYHKKTVDKLNNDLAYYRQKALELNFSREMNGNAGVT